MLENALTISLIAASFILSVISAITDARRGKVYNKILIIGFVMSLPFVTSYYYLFHMSLLRVYLQNCAFTAILCVLLYASRIWAAGDAKLVCLLVFTLPLGIYAGFASLFPALYLFVAVFSIAYLYVILESVVLSVKHVSQVKTRLIQQFGSKPKLLNHAAPFTAAMLLSSLASKIIRYFDASFYHNNPVIVPITVFMLLMVTFSLIKKGYWLMSAALLFANGAFAVLSKDAADLRAFIPATIITVFFIAARFIAGTFNYKLIKQDDLKPGMVLSLASAMYLAVQKDSIIVKTDETTKSRLTEEQVSMLKNWRQPLHLPGGAENDLQFSIVRLMPFSAFVLLGVVAICAGGLFLYG